MAHLDRREGDTVHLDVVDAAGNMVSATPSGGWLQSNPVIPGLGVPLNTRAQMFWLDEGLPTTLAPGRRPRTTLTPSMARAPDGTRLAFGTPGGDSQDQWQLFLLLHLVHHDMNLQEAIDAPLVLSGHLQSSFYPRGVPTPVTSWSNPPSPTTPSRRSAIRATSLKWPNPGRLVVSPPPRATRTACSKPPPRRA